MCGIAGYFGPGEIGQHKIDECLGLMGRRGPDYRDIYQHNAPSGWNCLLIHSRLSIIDLDPRSHQPFRRGDTVISYNGELYNYLELKEQLENRGERFATSSDTEVLAAILGLYGEDALDRCEGMWAFACYDEGTGGLLLSRDRFGEKPLYYYQDESGFYFGSEAKLVFALLGRRLPVNFEQIKRYLVNGYKSLYKADELFFEGLCELKAGRCLSLRPGGEPRQRSYWKPVLGQEQEMSFEEAVAGVKERLIEAVKIRLRADVPLAFCMSGGIDSNSLISIAKNVFNYQVHGFTIVNTDERYDEWDLVEHAVETQNLQHTAVPLETSGFLPKLRELISYHDAPVYTITYYTHWLLMEAVAANGYKISLSGSAADELFTGYFDHHNFYLSEMYRQDPVAYQQSLANWRQHIGSIVRNPLLKDPSLIVENPAMRDHIYFDADKFAARLYNYEPEPFLETAYCDKVLRNRMLNEMFHEAVPVILHEDDLNAMYYSIENRSPFLDRNLFEFCNSIPTRHLIKDGKAKAVLRESMRGIVPDMILDNPRKVGFNAPISDLLDLGNKDALKYILDDSPIFEVVKKSAIEKITSAETLPNSASKFLFYFVSSKLFLEQNA